MVRQKMFVVVTICLLILVGTYVYASSSALHKPQPNGWSPNGEWIVFSCGVYNNFEDWSHVYIMRPNGSLLLRVTGDDAIARSPTWSQDGQWIAFINGHDRNEIVKVKPDGTYSETIADVTKPEKIEDIDWSPTRAEIAYDSVTYNSTFNLTGSISLIDVNDKRQTLLTSSEDALARLKWSPDGETIAYANIGSNTGSLSGQGFYTMGREDKEPTLILDYIGIKLDLMWFGDGKSLLVTLTNQEYRLYNLNLESKALMPMKGDFWESPSLSPNGEWITFVGYSDEDVSKKGGDRTQIYKSRLDNTASQRLTQMTDCSVSSPDWFEYKKAN